MPRQARQISKTGIYHLISRGINREVIFQDDADRRRYIEILARIVAESSAIILGYCLMDNHIHLLVKEGSNGISNLMHRLGASYAYYYNCKYERVGHVFQNRFKSESVEDESYIKTLIRYIHQNPVKAGLASNPEEYRWSSCRVYYGGKDYLPELTSTELILGLFSEEKEKAIMELKQFTEMEISENCMEYSEGTALNDTQARQIIEILLQKRPLRILQELSKTDRDAVLHRLKQFEGLSIRQLSRLTGVSFNIVKRA